MAIVKISVEYMLDRFFGECHGRIDVLAASLEGNLLSLHLEGDGIPAGARAATCTVMRTADRCEFKAEG